MSKRLRLARYLLKDSGVIAVSIDDNGCEFEIINGQNFRFKLHC